MQLHDSILSLIPIVGIRMNIERTILKREIYICRINKHSLCVITIKI